MNCNSFDIYLTRYNRNNPGQKHSNKHAFYLSIYVPDVTGQKQNADNYAALFISQAGWCH